MPADTARRPDVGRRATGRCSSPASASSWCSSTPRSCSSPSRHRAVVPRRQHDDDVVGAVGLHARVRRPAGPGRSARRPMGPQAVFLGGLALFTVASALCGLAPTAGLADRRPHRPGRRRRRHHPDVAGPGAAGDAAERVPSPSPCGARWAPSPRRSARRSAACSSTAPAGAGCSSSTCPCASWPSSPDGGSSSSPGGRPRPFPDLVGSALLALGVGASRWRSCRATLGLGRRAARSGRSSPASC